jgi:type II secretory pathway pseudopilin PulG
MTATRKIVSAIVILAILVALAASRLGVQYVLEGNRTAVMAESIETALDSYKADYGHYPPPDFNLDELAIRPDGPRLKRPYFSGPPRDAWGHRFRYSLLNAKPKVYSAGPDGIFDTKDDIYAGGLECKRRYVFR